MATIQCKGCGKMISKKWKECPHCKEPAEGYIPNSNIQKESKLKRTMDRYKKISAEDSNTLTRCVACGESISKNASSCPHCGEPMQKTSSQKKGKKTSWWTWFALLLFIGYIVGSVDKSKTYTHTSNNNKSKNCNDFVYLKKHDPNFKRNLWKHSDRSGEVSGSAYYGDKIILMDRRDGNYQLLNFNNGTMGWISPIQVDRIQTICD